MVRALLAAITFISAIIIFGLIFYNTGDQAEAGAGPLVLPQSAPGMGGFGVQKPQIEENAQLRAKIAELETELAEEKQIAALAGGDLQQMSQAYQALMAHSEKQSQELVGLQAEKKHLENRVAALEDDLNKAREQIQGLNGSLEKANTHIQSLEAELESEWVKLAEANKIISQLETFLANRKVELEIAARQIVQLKTELSETKALTRRALLLIGVVILPAFSLSGIFVGYLIGLRSLSL